MAKSRAVGIDLGTTYSVVSYLDEQGPTQVVRSADGEVLTPSVVLFEKNEVIVGREAKKAAAARCGAVAELVKRDMGKEWYSREILGQRLHPEVIQAYILKKLKEDAAATLGPDFQVVITVPAYFDEPRRKATADAGDLAGLAVLDIVNEPTAAALSFGESLGYLTVEGEPREPMKVLVYDLGGGTFDVTVLDLRPGDLRTLATDGDVQLGGHDWDTRLVNYSAEQFLRQHHVDPRQTPASLAALQTAAEEAKRTLTARPKANLLVSHEGKTLELSIAREKFEELTEDLLERTAYTARQVVAAAKLTWADINRVLLVGGSTRMPMVSDMIERLSNLKPDHTVHPDEAVARGAAIFAGYLLRRRDPQAKQPFSVIDVNAHSLGIEGIDQRTMRKKNAILIRRNTPLPAKVTEKFVTKQEDQPSIVVKVLEGESKIPAQCTRIGRAVLRNLPEHLPKGWPIEVTYEYLSNGRLDVRAMLPGAGKQLQLELQRQQSLSSDKLGLWKKVVATSRGFDAFEDLLDDVVHDHRKQRRAEATPGQPAPKEVKAAAVEAPRAAATPLRNLAPPSPSPSPPARISMPSADLSAAGRAFAEAAPKPAAAVAARPPATAPVAAAAPTAAPPAERVRKPVWKDPEPESTPFEEQSAAEDGNSTAKRIVAVVAVGVSALLLWLCYHFIFKH